MEINKLQNIKLSTNIPDAEYIQNTFIHLSGDNDIGNLNISRNVTIGPIAVAENNSIALGYEVENGEYVNKAQAIGQNSVAIGKGCQATSEFAIAQGSSSVASGTRSIAVGYRCNATGTHTIAHGSKTYAIELYSHAEGAQTSSYGYASHAEGSNTISYGKESHSEGQATHAIGSWSHAEGNNTKAEGKYSHAEGDSCNIYVENGAEDNCSNSHVEGYYSNIYDSKNAFMHGSNSTISCANNAIALGSNIKVLSGDEGSFVWAHGKSDRAAIMSRGAGTFCIYPYQSELSNVYIGDKNTMCVAIEAMRQISENSSMKNQMKEILKNILDI